MQRECLLTEYNSLPYTAYTELKAPTTTLLIGPDIIESVQPAEIQVRSQTGATGTNLYTFLCSYKDVLLQQIYTDLSASIDKKYISKKLISSLGTRYFIKSAYLMIKDAVTAGYTFNPLLTETSRVGASIKIEDILKIQWSSTKKDFEYAIYLRWETI